MDERKTEGGASGYVFKDTCTNYHINGDFSTRPFLEVDIVVED